MAISSKDISSFILGLLANIISAYLFSLKIINLATLAFIIIGSIVIFIIIGIQLKTGEIREELENQKSEQKRLSEKLKIHEQLIEMKAEIKELQKRTK